MSSERGLGFRFRAGDRLFDRGRRGGYRLDAAPVSTSLYFRQIGRFQFNLKKYWCGLGFETWPPNWNGVTKRSFNFGCGYVSWRVR